MNTLAFVFMSVTTTFDLPPGLLSSLCYVESGHNVAAIHENDGGTRSRGICQIKVATAKSLGFNGTPLELQDPYTNVYYAGKLLKYQINRCKTIDSGIRAYNSGRCNTNNFNYAKKVMLAQQQGK